MQPPVTPASYVSTTTPLPRPPSTISSSSSSPSQTRRQLLVSGGSLLLVTAAGNAAKGAGPVAAAGYYSVTEAEHASSAMLSRRVGEAIRLLDLRRELQARGQLPEALASFTAVVSGYKDLALSEYTRVGRALVLYEIGDRDESITKMEASMSSTTTAG